MQNLKIVTGILITAFSSLMIMAATGDIFGESENEKGIIIGLLIFFMFFAAGGLYLTISSWRKKKNSATESIEREILGIIKSKGGRITPFEIASETSMSIDKAKSALVQMCEKGYGETQVTEDGNIVYVFYIPSVEEKASAKNPLDS